MKNLLNKWMLALVVLSTFGLASCGDDDDDKKTETEEVNYADAKLLKMVSKVTSDEHFFGPLVGECNYEYNADGYVSKSSDLSSENNLYDTFDYSKLKTENKIVVTHKYESDYDSETSSYTYFLENGRVSKITCGDKEVSLIYNGKNQLTKVVYSDYEYTVLTWENDVVTKIKFINTESKDESSEEEITYSTVPAGSFGSAIISTAVMCDGADGIGLNKMFGANLKYLPEKIVSTDDGENLVSTSEISFDSVTKLPVSEKTTYTKKSEEKKTQITETTYTWDIPSK